MNSSNKPSPSSNKPSPSSNKPSPSSNKASPSSIKASPWMKTLYFLNVMGFFGRVVFFLSLEPPNDYECSNSDPLDPKP